MSTTPSTANNQPFAFTEHVATCLADLPPDSIISRALPGVAPYKTTIFGCAAEQELSEHTAARAALFSFVEGEAAVTLGDERFDAKAGTLIAMQPNLFHSIVVHSIVAHTATQMLLIQVDAPNQTTCPR